MIPVSLSQRSPLRDHEPHAATGKQGYRPVTMILFVGGGRIPAIPVSSPSLLNQPEAGMSDPKRRGERVRDGAPSGLYTNVHDQEPAQVY